VWPTYEAATLAPFPLSGNALLPSPAPLQNGFPALAAVPLALSEHDHFYFSLPVANVDLGKFTPSQRYGVIEAADTKGEDPHLGLDIGLNSGTPIRAAAGGTVIWAGYGLLCHCSDRKDPYGIAVVIRHDFGFDGERLFTVYGHLEQTSVKVNQRVERGDPIGLSGNTGFSSGPHLHFEVRADVNNVYHTRNPELWLAPPEGYGVLVGRVTFTNGALLLKRLLEITSLDTGKKVSLYTYASQYKLLPDSYYKENVVLSNLPAGRYEIAIPYLAVWRRVTVEIKSGAVTYFTFRGTDEYSFNLPAEPPVAGVP
jgi:murein DD-endopeptidase MepM/ murein hydrolase activator NlpD